MGYLSSHTHSHFSSPMTNLRNILFAILILAFALRVAGVGHGLPLLVVDDEPPFVFSALKMLELKTLVLHGENFKDILYYPPYLAYALLPFFAVLAGLLFFRFGSLELLKTYVAADPSLFFLTARIVTAALGVLSVYLIYRFARNIWKTEAPALWAAFFTATSGRRCFFFFRSCYFSYHTQHGRRGNDMHCLYLLPARALAWWVILLFPYSRLLLFGFSSVNAMNRGGSC